MELWVIILGGLAVGLLCCLGWISVQSIIQGRLLSRPVPLAHARLFVGRTIAVCGAVRVVHAARSRFGDVLWYDVRYEEKRGWGRNRRWVTVAHETHAAHFILEAGEHQISIRDEPTEVQGTESRTDYDYGWLTATSRVTHRWLPIPTQATVMGKLECSGGAMVMVRDRWVGLLVSPGSPESAARWETIKGWLGLLLVVAAVIAAVWFFAFGTF